ncbi:MAG: CdaR family transcriptional regulator [Vibrio sp.]
MEIDTNLAKQIVSRTKKIIHYPINVMDTSGMILASTNESRLYQMHSGAILAINQKSLLEINEDIAGNMPGTKPGVNLPILFQDKVIGAIGISGPPAEIRYLAELVRMAAEMTVEHAYMIERTHWAEQNREDFLLQWVDQTSSFEFIQNQADFLRFNIYQPHTVIIIELNNSVDPIVFKNSLQRRFPDNLIAQPSSNNILFLCEKDNLDKNVKTILGINDKDIVVSVGKHYNDPRELYKSYASALTILNHSHHFNQHDTVLTYNKYKLAVVLEGKRGDWQEEIFSDVVNTLNQNDPNLKKTLSTWFACNLDISITAEKLFIHRNSVRYRLNKVCKLFDIDLDNINDRFFIYSCLLMS